MNLWLIGLVVLLAGAIALGPTVVSWLIPSPGAQAAAKLLVVLSTWQGIRDFRATVILQGQGEIEAELLFLVPSNLRFTVKAPESLAGETFALRPVEGGWLFIHHLPALGLGIEDRFTAGEVSGVLPFPSPAELHEGLRRGGIQVSYAPANDGSPSDEFDIQGLPGQFPRIALRVDPVTSVPRGVILYTHPTQPPVVTIAVKHLEEKEGESGPAKRNWLLEVNAGLTLRDVFLLDPPPTRWVSPTPAG